jgi:anti-sigma factor RsiW
MGGMSMGCNLLNLQTYLDGELSRDDTTALKTHLDGCLECRRELSRLRLLWFELGQTVEVQIPGELPYLRQQAISQARARREKAVDDSEFGFLEAQRLAWRPMLVAASHLPGQSLLGSAGRLSRGLSGAISSGLTASFSRYRGRRRNR